jgi:phage terminase large subunit
MPKLNSPQADFIFMPKKFRAFVAGYGSGKTWVGCSALLNHFREYPNINAGYFAPTYTHIRDIFYPTIEEVAEDWGFEVEIKVSDKEVRVFRNGQQVGLIKCRSMDKPSSIVGFKIGHAVVDELDVMESKKASIAWRKIIARMRYKIDGLKNGVDVTTTPEGFKFTYEQFVKAVRDNQELQNHYGLIHASTYDNEANLPDDYIQSLKDTYPENLIEAYLNGQFVNLTSGTIYHQFSPKLNASDEAIKQNETLFIGMDFNVGKMSAVVCVKRDGLPHAVDEIVNGYDTPDMIRIIKERHWQYENGRYIKSREIRIFPDASGKSRKSVNASETDLQLLRDAGFYICAKDSNPPVKDRINAVNAMICNANGLRRFRVNISKCPVLVECLEQQVWAENGEPDKKGGKDHTNDALGYFLYYDYPLTKPAFETSMRTMF